MQRLNGQDSVDSRLLLIVMFITVINKRFNRVWTESHDVNPFQRMQQLNLLQGIP